jgi:hypothetical protein
MVVVPAGYQAGYIAVEASGCGEDLTYWVLDQSQMDEVEDLYKENNDYCEAMNEVIENHNLGLAGQRANSIKEAMGILDAKKMVLVEDFNYIGY